jgi:hypothetical protein
MNTSPHWYSRICLTGFLAVLACSDSSAPTADSQSVDFSYAGAVSGHFRAVGPATAVGNPARSFAVAFRSAAGETQLCAYQPVGLGNGNFFLLNIGVINGPGRYTVPPTPVGTSHQPGTFLLGVDPSHTSVEQISTFVEGEVEVQEFSAARVRGTFTVTTLLTATSDGRFDVGVAALDQLPIICQ